MTGQGSKDASSSIWLAVERVGLPDKKYFKIGEVAALVGVEPHVLRYWQTQFPQVRPQKSRSGHRLYRRKDVETLLLVRELLHVQRFTIAGARQALRGLVKSDRPSTGLPAAVDDEAAPVAQARPYAEQPRAAATEVMRLEIEALEDDDLDDALARQLVEARAGGAITAVDAYAVDEQEDLDEGDPTRAAAGPDATALADEPGAMSAAPPPAFSSQPASAASTLPGASAALASARAPSLSSAASAPSLPLVAAAQPAARATSSVAVSVASAPLPAAATPERQPAAASAAVTSSALRDRARKEQLGFGFIPSNRGALEAARSEVLAMMDLIDREEAAANRLRVRPSAAKT